ncbi:hypothetical protein ACIOWM_20125 [Streptomyces anulatus]
MFAHPGGDDAITEVYSVPDDARYLEPDLVRDQRFAPRPLRQGTAPLNQTPR